MSGDLERPTVAQLQNVSKVYGGGEARVIGLRDLSLTVRKGDNLAVMGASGSGKSTAMNILGCLDRPTSCLLYTSPSPRDATLSRMPSSA